MLVWIIIARAATDFSPSRASLGPYYASEATHNGNAGSVLIRVSESYLLKIATATLFLQSVNNVMKPNFLPDAGKKNYDHLIILLQLTAPLQASAHLSAFAERASNFDHPKLLCELRIHGYHVGFVSVQLPNGLAGVYQLTGDDLS